MKALILAAAMAVMGVAASPIFAQDAPGSDTPDGEKSQPVPQSLFRVFGGFSSADLSVEDDYWGTFDYDTGLSWMFGGAWGKRVGSVGFDGEFTFRDTFIDDLGIDDLSFFTGSALINGWVFQDLGEDVTLYGGGGVGLALSRYTAPDYESSDAMFGLAWQLGGGVWFDLDNGNKWGVGVRRFSSPGRSDEVFEGAEISYTTTDVMLEWASVF